MLFTPKKRSFKKVQKSKFFKGVGPWFLSKNRIFYQGYFLGKLIKNSLVFDVLDRKECFLDHKNEVLKKPRKWKYFKGVSPWFVSKNRMFY